jgi:uncharacterized repeat protein (TIGR03803 family)
MGRIASQYREFIRFGMQRSGTSPFADLLQVWTNAQNEETHMRTEQHPQRICRKGGELKKLVGECAILLIVAGFSALAQAQTVTLIHSFEGGAKDGFSPTAGLILGIDGNFYGTTYNGGPTDAGVIFRVNPAGLFSLLFTFGADNDANPIGRLVQDSAGYLYGTTYDGGKYASGTVFKFDIVSDKLTILHNFTGKTGGGNPKGDLLITAAGAMVGTTFWGGSPKCYSKIGCGVVFQLSPSKFTVLHTFAGSPKDGAHPAAGFIQDSAGNLYSTTSEGGAYGDGELNLGYGTVFKLSPAGKKTTLYSFGGVASDGIAPSADLISDSSGNLYGTAAGGGIYGAGTVFEVTPGGKETALYQFTGGDDGDGPVAPLVRDAEGNLYGTTLKGGSAGFGVVFELSKSGTFTVLHTFAGPPNDGSLPEGGLLPYNGVFYGTTIGGGKYGDGTIYKLEP